MKPLSLIYAVLPAIILISCTGQAVKTTYDNQEKRIDQFVSANQSMRAVYNGGSVRLVIAEGTGEEELASDGVVSLYYAGYVFSGSNPTTGNMFATNHPDLADTWKTSEGTFEIETVKLGEDPLVEGLKNGLVGVKSGEECYIVFSGKYAYGQKAFGTIPANSPLIYHIWIDSISNE